MKAQNVRLLYRILLILVDVVSVALCAVAAFLVSKFGDEVTKVYVLWAVANAVLTVGVFWMLRLYRIVFSSVGLIEAIKNAIGCMIIGGCNLVFVLATKRVYVGLSTAFVFIVMLFSCTLVARYSKRLLCLAKLYLHRATGKKTRVMIVGGGGAGQALLKEIQTSDKIDYKPVCIVDDDMEKYGQYLSGVRISGQTKDIPELVKKYRVEEIFITMPSVEKKRIKEIVRICKGCNVPVKSLPGIYQLAMGQVTVSGLKEVLVEDLLGRDQVCVDLDEIMRYIENKTVLVTGGGGSIGSELCRQIATHKPKTLIILDVYENNAYEIEQELKRKDPSLHLLTLIASVRDLGKMRDVFEKYRPEIVFHAAAHKHVPLMETSPNEAVKNNVFGTLNVARCADEFGVETFVQISTDKAVNPTNIMGATKRICEMIIQTIGRHSKNTKFVAVRFGNVLGSNGSVIPLFKKQIAEGGPVTVTHKDIIRYFMTIPEAVSLVLQAGAYAKDGQIFVLDMGEPVRIYDLAYNLIKQSGLEPNVDIDIVCTGLRPGEKLYEERLMEEEGLQKTANGLISVAKPIELDEEHLWRTLDKLYKEAYEEADGMKYSVQELVSTYKVDKRDSIAEALQECAPAKSEVV